MESHSHDKMLSAIQKKATESHSEEFGCEGCKFYSMGYRCNCVWSKRYAQLVAGKIVCEKFE